MYALNSERMDPTLNTLCSVVGSAWYVCEPLDHDMLVSESIIRYISWLLDETFVITWDKKEQTISIVTSEAE